MIQRLLFWILVVAFALIFGFIASCLSGDITLSETLLSLRSSSLFSFLKKSKKKREKRKEISFFQISFLKKKIKKKKWRDLFENCLLEYRGNPPYKIFAEKKEEREEFREFWTVSSNSSSLEEKEREWVGEVEDNVRKREKEVIYSIYKE